MAPLVLRGRYLQYTAANDGAHLPVAYREPKRQANLNIYYAGARGGKEGLELGHMAATRCMTNRPRLTSPDVLWGDSKVPSIPGPLATFGI